MPANDLTNDPKTSSCLPLYVCSGLPGCGSTLVSWCFLQRSDMHGVLDGCNDILPSLHPESHVGRIWLKSTISAFRLSEMVAHYRDEGWDVRPLLIVRDLRCVWASLSRKSYRYNGITAEDPPMRLRFRRFVADWELFRSRNWPILRYEDLVKQPTQTLMNACSALGLSWDEAMLSWPRAPEEIRHRRQGNGTFWRTCEASLPAALMKYAEEGGLGTISDADCDFLESEFEGFNRMNGYPLKFDIFRTDHLAFDMSRPSFDQTRRFRWENKRNPWRRVLHWLGAAPRQYQHRLTID